MNNVILCFYESKYIDENSNRVYYLNNISVISIYNRRRVIFKKRISFTNHHDMREFVMKTAKENHLEIEYVSSFGSYLVDNVYYINISGNCIPEKYFHNKI